MPFTAQDLEEMRLADEEIEREFCQTQEEIEACRRRDRRAEFEALPIEKRKVAASRKAYREANREKVAASQKAWYEANREKVAASQNWIAAARKAAGYTQADVARMIGVSAASVSYLESGKMNLENFTKNQNWRRSLMTEKEIVQALRLCGKIDSDCRACNLWGEDHCVERSNSAAADLIERLLAENAALREKVPQWISVEDADRRAPAGQRVLATDGVLVGEAYRTSADSWRRYDDYRLWYDATGHTVTHWMPLPEGPEEGGKHE